MKTILAVCACLVTCVLFGQHRPLANADLAEPVDPVEVRIVYLESCIEKIDGLLKQRITDKALKTEYTKIRTKAQKQIDTLNGIFRADGHEVPERMMTNPFSALLAKSIEQKLYNPATFGQESFNKFLSLESDPWAALNQENLVISRYRPFVDINGKFLSQTIKSIRVQLRDAAGTVLKDDPLQWTSIKDGSFTTDYFTARPFSFISPFVESNKTWRDKYNSGGLEGNTYQIVLLVNYVFGETQTFPLQTITFALSIGEPVMLRKFYSPDFDNSNLEMVAPVWHRYNNQMSPLYLSSRK